MQIIFGHFEKETYLLSWVFDKKISTNLMSPANLKPANIRMTFISHFSNVHVRKLFCKVRQRLLFQVYWILLLTSVGPLSTGYLQDGAALELSQKWAAARWIWSRNVRSFSQTVFKMCVLTKTVEQIVQVVHTHLHTLLSPSTNHNHIYFLVQSSSQ